MRGKKGKNAEVEGPFREKKKRGEGGCKVQGVGKENSQGRIRVWRLGGLGPVLGCSHALSNFDFLLQINFDKTFSKNGDDKSTTHFQIILTK